MDKKGPQIIKFLNVGEIWVLIYCGIIRVPERGPRSYITTKGFNGKFR